MDTETTMTNRINPAQAALIPTAETGALDFRDASQFMEFAKMMSVASVAIPKHLRGNPGACLAIAMQASEWRMSPFAVANKSYSVNDRLAYEAQLVNAVILARAPIEGRFSVSYKGEGSHRKCSVAAKLRTGEIVLYESPEIGQIKVKNSPLWQSDPDQQLFYFSSRSLCRRHFPDVLLGIYTPDELANERDVTNSVVARSEPLDPFAETLAKSEPIARENAQESAEKAIEEVDPEDERLAAFCSDVEALKSCAHLTEARSLATEFADEIHRTTAKAKVKQQADALGFTWSSKLGKFIQEAAQ